MASVPPPLVRRSLSLPAAILGAALAVLLSVVAVPLLVLVDVVRAPRRLPWTRSWLLAVSALVTESIAATWCFALGLWFGPFGRIRGPASSAAHIKVQHWWVRHHLRNFRRLAGVRIHVDDLAPLDRGGAVVMARHASHVDALIPAFVAANVAGRTLRYTLKDDLQLSPALDLAANRLPNVFVDRTPGPDSPVLDRVEALAAGAGPDDVCVIFPEGTFHTPARHTRAVERLAASRPDLEELAGELRSMLPPRPAGTLALLRGAPDADIVILGHVGLEGFGSLKEMLTSIPLTQPTRIRLWRFDRSTAPDDDKELVAWLLERWVEVDRWIGEQLELRARGEPLAPDPEGRVPREVLA